MWPGDFCQIPNLLKLSLTCKLHIFLSLYLVDIFCLVLIKISVNLPASIISPHRRTGDQPCDLINCRIYGE